MDDFEETYRRVKELGILEKDTFFQACTSFPTGASRCTSATRPGNLVECCWPDVETLDRSQFPELKRLEDSVPQTEEGRRATLYLDRAKA